MKQAIIGVILLLAAGVASAQDSAQLRLAEETKWAKASGLSPFVIHRLWRMASHFVDERDDDSHIVNVIVSKAQNGSAADIVLVTSPPEGICVTVTVLSHPQNSSFAKVWSRDQTPDGDGFCSTPFGDVKVDFKDGVVSVFVPAVRTGHDSASKSAGRVYQYGWRGTTYGYIGKR